MSAYEELYEVIAEDDYYNMDWSLAVGLEPTIGNEVYIMEMQFVGWGPYKQGVKFFKQEDDNDPVEIPESTELTQKFIDFFETERKGKNNVT